MGERAPWSAADAPVGLVVGGKKLTPLIGSGSRGTGVRPTNRRELRKVSDIGLLARGHPGNSPGPRA